MLDGGANFPLISDVYQEKKMFGSLTDHSFI